MGDQIMGSGIGEAFGTQWGEKKFIECVGWTTSITERMTSQQIFKIVIDLRRLG
jgi:hypothetical protein